MKIDDRMIEFRDCGWLKTWQLRLPCYVGGHMVGFIYGMSTREVVYTHAHKLWIQIMWNLIEVLQSMPNRSSYTIIPWNHPNTN